VAEQDHSQASLLQLMLGNIAAHAVNIYYFQAGMLQPYTLLLMMHLALLMNLPSFVLFGRFSFRGFQVDRWCFLANFLWTLCEFPFLIERKFISRNLDLCQALVWEDQEFGTFWRAALSTQLGLHALLLGYHFYTCYCDGRANAGEPNIALWKMIRPSYLMWKKNKWEPQRKVIAICGCLLFTAGILIAESCVASFAEAAASTISTQENQINAYGQLVPLVATGLSCFTTFCNSWRYICSNYRWYDTLFSSKLVEFRMEVNRCRRKGTREDPRISWTDSSLCRTCLSLLLHGPFVSFPLLPQDSDISSTDGGRIGAEASPIAGGEGVGRRRTRRECWYHTSDGLASLTWKHTGGFVCISHNRYLITQPFQHRISRQETGVPWASSSRRDLLLSGNFNLRILAWLNLCFLVFLSSC
jgi:hypothetical protein